MRAVTSFVAYSGRVLLLKRSGSMPTMPGLWGAVSGIMCEGESPISRALAEIREETGMVLVRPVSWSMEIPVPAGAGLTVRVQSFLFLASGDTVRLNRENDEYRWILPRHVRRYDTVPHLAETLFGLLCGVEALLGQHDIDAGAPAHGARDVVPRMLPGAGVYEGRLLGVY